MGKNKSLLERIKPEYLGMIESEREKNVCLVNDILTKLSNTEYVADLTYGDFINIRLFTCESNLYLLFKELQ